MVALSIPFPPSLNSIWRAYKGRMILSAPYRAWRSSAACSVADQLSAYDRTRIIVEGPYRLTLTVSRPDRRARDLDNLPKAISDLLKASGVIRDDSDCTTVTVEWSADKPAKGARVVAVIEPDAEAIREGRAVS